MTCWASQADADHAASEAEADKRAEFVEKFSQDACDEMLCTEGNAAYLTGEVGALETKFLRVLWANPENAFHRIVELRDALRAEVLKRYPSDVDAVAKRLADEFIREAA